MHHNAPLPYDEPFSPAPGHLLVRRSFLGVAAAAFATAGLPAARSQWRSRERAGGWTVEEFVREVTPVAKELVADTSALGQDRYLLTLAAFAVRLGEVPLPADANQVKKGHWIGANHGPDPFTVLHWKLEAGVPIQPHAHTYGNVVTLGLTGEALVSNYEMRAPRDYDTTEAIEVVRVQEQVLRPGDVNLVSLERHYVHGFLAGPAGASGLDITTRIAPKRKAPVLEVGAPIDGPARTFRGRWIGG